MARKKTVIIREHVAKSGVMSYYARFTDQDGIRREELLGRSDEGWTREQAAAETVHILSGVLSGRWRPKGHANAAAAAHPLFIDFEADWWEAKQRDIRENTVKDYNWRLDYLVAHFGARTRVRDISIEDVDALKGKLLDKDLSPASVNKILMVLAQMLDDAVEKRLLDRNPARGKNRRAKEPKTRDRAWLDYDQFVALMDAARELDTTSNRYNRIGREPLLGVLFLAGLRVHELCALRWRDLDLDHRYEIVVRQSKTAAGIRHVEIGEHLLGLLRDWKQTCPDARPTRLVFPTDTGNPRNKDSVRQRILDPVRKRAAALLEQRGQAPFWGYDEEHPYGQITTHAGRRTAVTYWCEVGEDADWVMDQVGHEDAKLTLQVYRQRRNRRKDPRIIHLMRRVSTSEGDEDLQAA